MLQTFSFIQLKQLMNITEVPIPSNLICINRIFYSFLYKIGFNRNSQKIKQSYKPGSVLLPKEQSLSFIWACRHQQALAPYPQERSEDLRRAASSLAYLDFQLLRFAITAVANCVVGSYPAFSPLPHFAMGRYFLCGTGCQRLVTLPSPSR